MKKLLLSFIAVVSAFCASAQTPVTIDFGNGTGDVNVNNAEVTFTDEANNSWTVTTVGTTSFTPNGNYAQIGSSKKPASTITATTTFAADANINITAVEVKFGGFSNTAGNVSIKLGGTEIATGKLNGTSDVTVKPETGINESAAGKALEISVTGIAKGVKLYYITYTYENAVREDVDHVEPALASVEEGTYDSVQTIELSCATNGAKMYYILNDAEAAEYTEPIVLKEDATLTTYATYTNNDGTVVKSEEKHYTYIIKIDTTKGGVADFTCSTWGDSDIQPLDNAKLDDYITISTPKSGSTNPGYYQSDKAVHVYTNEPFTISSSLGNITEIVFTAGRKTGSMSSDPEGYDNDTFTWTGSAKTVTFTPAAQFRFTAVKVTYEGLAPQPVVLYLIPADTQEVNEANVFTLTDGTYSIKSTLECNYFIGNADKTIVFGAAPEATAAEETSTLAGVLGSEIPFTNTFTNNKEGDYFEVSFAWDGKAEQIGMNVVNNSTTGIADIEAAEAEAVYYNLQGVRVAEPTTGIFIKVQGTKATKVVL